MIILFTIVAVLVEGVESAAIHIVITPFHVPFDLASILCGSPGVAYSIQFFIAVESSTATQGSSLDFESVSVDETVASALIGSSVFFSSLQEANRNAAAQMVKVIRFIK